MYIYIYIYMCVYIYMYIMYIYILWWPPITWCTCTFCNLRQDAMKLAQLNNPKGQRPALGSKLHRVSKKLHIYRLVEENLHITQLPSWYSVSGFNQASKIHGYIFEKQDINLNSRWSCVQEPTSRWSLLTHGMHNRRSYPIAEVGKCWGDGFFPPHM